MGDNVVALSFLSGQRVLESAKSTKVKGKGKCQKSVGFVEDSDNGEDPEANAAFTDSQASLCDEGEVATPVAKRHHPCQAKTAAVDNMEQLLESCTETRGLVGPAPIVKGIRWPMYMSDTKVGQVPNDQLPQSSRIQVPNVVESRL